MQDPRALEAFFNPASVAVVGASSDPRKPGNTALRNMIDAGYRGRIHPINPREETILGLRCHRSVLDIAEPLDCCVLLISAEHTLAVARDLVDRKRRLNDIRTVVCMSAGFGELESPEAVRRQEDLAGTLRAAGIRMIGPNCLGVMDAVSGFNTNFDIGAYPAGGISVLTQSGALGNSFLLWAGANGVAGLNKFVSIGNMADVGMAEMIAYWNHDPSTKVIGVYCEGLRDPRAFAEAARQVSASKPMVMLKAGRSEQGTRAALSHTGAVAGADAIYDGALKQAGVIRVAGVAEFYDTLRAFDKQPAPPGNRVSVLTHMGGPGTVCIDEIAATPSLRMAEFSGETREALKALVSPAANVGHPDGYIDLTAAHTEQLHNQVLGILFADPGIDMVIQILAPSAFLDQGLLARQIAAAYIAQGHPKKTLLNVVTFGSFARQLRDGLEQAGLPVTDFSDLAAKVAGNFARFAAVRAGAMARDTRRAVPAPAAEGPAGALIEAARAGGRASLLEPEAYEVCAQYGLRVPPYRVVAGADEAHAAAEAIGYPVVLKVVSAEILHKTDVGGVMLGIGSGDALRQAVATLEANVKRAAPHAADARMLVQKMVPGGTELVLGALRDPLFGPTVMVGMGGIYVEVLKKVGFRLAPLSEEEAAALIGETLPRALVAGARGRAPIDIDALARPVVALARMMIEQPGIAQVDLNPFLPGEQGGVAVDARIIVQQQRGSANGTP